MSLVYICHSIILQLFSVFPIPWSPWLKTVASKSSMVSDPKNHQLVLVPFVPDIWSPTPFISVFFHCFSLFFYDFWWIWCRCPWWNLLPLLHQHGPWPPLHAPTPHLQIWKASCRNDRFISRYFKKHWHVWTQWFKKKKKWIFKVTFEFPKSFLGTPSYHPFLAGIFPWKSSWGTSPLSWRIETRKTFCQKWPETPLPCWKTWFRSVENPHSFNMVSMVSMVSCLENGLEKLCILYIYISYC